MSFKCFHMITRCLDRFLENRKKSQFFTLVGRALMGLMGLNFKRLCTTLYNRSKNEKTSFSNRSRSLRKILKVPRRCSCIRRTQRTLNQVHTRRRKKNAAHKTGPVGKCVPEGVFDMRISYFWKILLFLKNSFFLLKK